MDFDTERLQELAGILTESVHGNKRVMIIALERDTGSVIDIMGPGTFASVMADRFGNTPELRQSFMEALSGSVDGSNGSKSFHWDDQLMMVVIPTRALIKS